MTGLLDTLVKIVPPSTRISAPFCTACGSAWASGRAGQAMSCAATNLRSLDICALPLFLKLISTDRHRSAFLHLQSLSLQWRDQEYIVGALRNLQTPALESLSLTYTESASFSGLTTALHRFLPASAPPLKELRLLGVYDVYLTALVDVLPDLDTYAHKIRQKELEVKDRMVDALLLALHLIPFPCISS
jgi:hypothetical protein